MTSTDLTSGEEMASPRTELRELVRDFTAARVPTARVRDVAESDPAGFDREAWSEFAGLGCAAVVVPEPFGGSGGDLLDAAVILEETGRRLAPMPTLATLVAGELLTRLGARDGEVAARERLSRLASATDVYGIGAGHPRDVEVSPDGVGWSLRGTTVLVDGRAADHLVLPATGLDGVVWVLVRADAPGLRTENLVTYDLTRPLVRIGFDDTPATLLAAGDEARRASLLADAALAAEQLGGADACLDMAVQYSKLREQFGRPIGSFQAIKHKLVDMLVELELCRSVVSDAWDALATGRAECELAVAGAVAISSETYRTLAAGNLHVHGGIGYTWEHDAQLYFKRAFAGANLFGGAARAHELVTQLSSTSTSGAGRG